MRHWAALSATFLGILVLASPQEGLGQPDPAKKDFFKGGPFGKGGPGGETRKILKDFDKDGDKRLNAEERQAAREFLKKDGGGGKMGFGSKGGFGKGMSEPTKPGPNVNPADVKNYPATVSLYEPTALRTIFLEFEEKDWEAELQEFHNTDVQVPATLTVDGKKYPNVGVHFRGMSSYFMVPAGAKRSLNLDLDFADSKQRLYGYKTLNLLNGHEDHSALSTVLYSHVVRQYMPAPKANMVKVVINGESWGIYTNVQQFNKEFLAENYKSSKGARWKVRGNPGARGGLEYFGDKIEDYKRVFTIKSSDDEKSWKALINLCKVLNTTPADKLEEALKPILDIDNVLWFLALDVAVVNGDGYWTRASDYSLFMDEKGKFRVFPSDMNECFMQAGGPPMGGPGGMRMFGGPPRPGELLPSPLQEMLQLTANQKKQLAELQKEVDGKLDKVFSDEQRVQVKQMREAMPMGPGGFGPPGGPPMGPGGPGGFGPPGGPGGFGMGGGGINLDPLVGLNNSRMPLRSKLFAVSNLREKYLEHVRTIADKSLDWKNLGPVVAQYRKLLERELEIDTRKLESLEAFKKSTADEISGPVNGREMPLRAFADQRRKFLLDYKEPKVTK